MHIRGLIRPGLLLLVAAASWVGLAAQPLVRAAVADRPVPPAAGDAGALQAAELRVAIKVLEPFVIRRDDQPAGFSIDLWNEIARRNGWKFRYTWVETVGEQIDAVAKGQAEVAIAGITITSAREERVDFSVRMFDAGLQVMTREQHDNGLISSAKAVFTKSLVYLIAAMGVLVVLVGHIVWLVSRKDPEWPKGYFRGVWEGTWTVGAALASGDYAERRPARFISRLAALTWIVVSVLFIAYFTGVVTSRLTVDQIKGDINGPGDLPGKRVLAPQGTTAANWLSEQGIGFTPVANVAAAYPKLEAGDADAIVFDAPVLTFYAQTGGAGKVRVVGTIFRPEAYGIAVTQGSPYRKQINTALLEIAEDGTYERLYTRWFGQRR